jgi:hypothetical protein
MSETPEADRYASFFFQHPESSVDVLSVMEDCFSQSPNRFSKLSIMTGTVSEAGVSNLSHHIDNFCDAGGEVEIFIGLGLGPSSDAIQTLMEFEEDYQDRFFLRLAEAKGEAGLFHPKVYWFQGDGEHIAIIGSANWSDSGFTNSIEAASVLRATDIDENLPGFVTRLEEAFESLRAATVSESSWVTMYPPTDDLLSELSGTDSDTSVVETSEDLDLSGVPSTTDTLWPLNQQGPLLLMDVLKESRGTQLVPTDEIWERYFDVDSDKFDMDSPNLPSFDLTNIRTGETITRPIVTHDHQGTIDIPELDERSNPGEGNDFVIFLRTDSREYTYQVFFEEFHSDVIEDIEAFMTNYGFKTGNKRRAFLDL